jgi:hypothetical protein
VAVTLNGCAGVPTRKTSTSAKRSIWQRESQSDAEKKARWKADDKRRNAEKRARWEERERREEERERRKEERERRMGNGTEEQLVPRGRLGSKTADDESWLEDTDSTLPYTSHSDQDNDEDSHGSDTEWKEKEAISDEDSDDDDLEKRHNRPLRYMAMIRVPWLNRRSRRGEWGFHCVG